MYDFSRILLCPPIYYWCPTACQVLDTHLTMDCGAHTKIALSEVILKSSSPSSRSSWRAGETGSPLHKTAAWRLKFSVHFPEFAL